MLLDTLAHDVLSRYPAALRGDLVFLGNHGGFSGASLWRLNTATGSFCLKAWPRDWRSAGELAWIHGLMGRAERLPWMPRVLRTTGGESFVELHGRLWELASWMPGCSDPMPAAARVESACAALAQLHLAWAPLMARQGVCPAVERRLDACSHWRKLVQTGWRPTWTSLDTYRPESEQLWQLVATHLDDVPRRLVRWLPTPAAIQPCVCDLWHDHVLFTDDTVTGLIDFGSVKEDHVAVDLARLLGSMAGNQVALWDVGLSAYRKLRPLSAEEAALARDLDRTGTIVAAMHWLRWLYLDERTFEHTGAVRRRLLLLTARLRELRDGY